MTKLPFLLLVWSSLSWGQDYLWPHDESGRILAEVIAPPKGYERVAISDHGFGAWLRRLPLGKVDAPVKLYNGSLKPNQDAHVEVVNLDVGRGNLQQCADAIIRLRAEYLYSQKSYETLVFNFTSGHPASWINWRNGERPIVSGQHVSWKLKASRIDDYDNFRAYLNNVFTYAGSASLAKELKKVEDPALIQPGDVFIEGGFPGHAVLVLDVAENQHGHRVFLLGQSYMPAQEFHILKNPQNSRHPWYDAQLSGNLATPEWLFRFDHLKRF